MTYTPGPWIADDCYMQDGRRVRVSQYDGADDYYLRCPTICECAVGTDGDGDPSLLAAEANALLIQATPDLIRGPSRHLRDCVHAGSSCCSDRQG
jgi:hypothetical protein